MKLLTTLLMSLSLTTCATMAWKGSIGYSGQYGDYSVGSDGKNIITDIRLKDPKGYAK